MTELLNPWDLDARGISDSEIASAARNEAIPILPCPICPRILCSYDEIGEHCYSHYCGEEPE